MVDTTTNQKVLRCLEEVQHQGQELRNNPAIPEGQRPPVETVPGGSRASNPGRPNTGRGRGY